MMSTPAKPTAIASQRRQRTSSPNTSAAPIVTASGSACSTADVVASGMCASAIRKVIVASASAADRSATSGCSACRGLRSAPCDQASRAISTVAKRPRSSMTWPMFMDARHEFGHGVVGREAGHRDRHEDGAAKVVGKQQGTLPGIVFPHVTPAAKPQRKWTGPQPRAAMAEEANVRGSRVVQLLPASASRCRCLPCRRSSRGRRGCRLP